MKTTVFIFSLIIWALGVKTSENLLSANYTAQEVSLSSDQKEIKGTFVSPAQNENCPIVLLIAGSGPTDRDGNQPTLKNNSFKMLAESLAENGIATLRYDKRGIAQSYYPGFSNASILFDDYVTDAGNWIRKLKAEHQGAKIFVAGLSEGSLIGMIASRDAGADGFISLNGPGSPANEIIIGQIKAQGTPQQVIDQVQEIIDKIKAGEKAENVPPYLMALFNADIQPYMRNWFQYDPAVELAKLTIPVLIIQGKTDKQIKVTDAEKLKKVCPNAKLTLIDGMNHILKNAPDDLQANFATYNQPDLPLNEELVKAVVGFVH